RLAPRINAVGRLGQAEIAVELLTTTRRERAVDLARHLESLNKDRQEIERKMLVRAKEQLISEGRVGEPALVLAVGHGPSSHGPGWHGGVVGIVAGRLAEQYGRPALLITLPRAPEPEDGEHVRLATGSGRSISGVPLHEALKACGDLLAGHGGHAKAAGFRLR